MDVIIVMCVGVFIGNKIFPAKLKKWNEILQTVCTVLLIFSMGVMLGRRENFIQELSSLGIQSFLLFFIPSVFSVILVYPLSKYFLEKRKSDDTKEEMKLW